MFADNLMELRKYHSLSQEELAEKVYVTRQTISNLENGKSYPDIQSLLLLSSLFNVSLDQLIKGDIETVGQRIEGDANDKLFFRPLKNRPRSLGANGRLTAIIRHIIGEY